MRPTVSPKNRPKLYYGWWITLTLAITETVSWGIIFYAFSVFITSTEADFGWSRSQITGAFSVALLVMAGMSFPVGWILDRFGGRVLMTTGSVIGTLLIFSLAYINSLPLFYIVWAFLGMTAAMVFYEPSFVIVARWFTRFRPRALAMITFAAGFASTIFLPLTDYLIRHFGREQAWMLLALILGTITIPLHGFVLRRSPESMGLVADGIVLKRVGTNGGEDTAVPPAITVQQAVRQATFWWFALAFGLAMLSNNAIRIHFIPFLVD